MNQCDNQHTFVIPDVCKIFNQKNIAWTDLMLHTIPKTKCPLKPPLLKFRNATSDVSFLTYLPLDGYIWTVSVRMFKPIANVRHKKRLLFCIMIEATIQRGGQNPQKGSEIVVH